MNSASWRSKCCPCTAYVWLNIDMAVRRGSQYASGTVHMCWRSTNRDYVVKVARGSSVTRNGWSSDVEIDLDQNFSQPPHAVLYMSAALRCSKSSILPPSSKVTSHSSLTQSLDSIACFRPSKVPPNSPMPRKCPSAECTTTLEWCLDLTPRPSLS